MNFLGAHECYYREEKITRTKINKIAKAYHKVKDLEHKKISKDYLPITYGEFKDIFSKK